MKKLAIVIASILAVYKRKTSEPGGQTKSDVNKK